MPGLNTFFIYRSIIFQNYALHWYKMVRMKTKEEAVFPAVLKDGLRDLPGYEAHKLMISEFRRKDLAKQSKSSKTRESSVLCLLYPIENVYHCALIKRPEYEGVHSGQISFPGGKAEKCDKNLLATALRETKEEIGVILNENQVIGQLSDVFIPVSNFNVSVFLAYSSQRPTFKADNKEVAEIIELNLQKLCYGNIKQNVTLELKRYGTFEIPAFVYQNHIIWGATAMMLSELQQILRKIL